MQIVVPVRYSLNLKAESLGRIRQLLSLPRMVAGEWVPFTKGRHPGHRISEDGGRTGPLVFAKAPPIAAISDEPDVIIARELRGDHQTVDLREGRWLPSGPGKDQIPLNDSSSAERALASWVGAFHYAEEDLLVPTAGLRKPQIGALHAIHAHWSTSSAVATVIMPTGVGKTETMLSTMVSARCACILVIVPSDPLRKQIASKFETLGAIYPGSPILDHSAHFPVVGTLEHKPATPEAARGFFRKCNVVVATSQLIGGCSLEVQAEIASVVSHLFIDEAHHSEAATWKGFRAKFDKKPVLQFTATPFREDGKRIDGTFIYSYPLRLAQANGYFRPIRFHDVEEFDRTRSDLTIAKAAIEELDNDLTKKHIVMARVADISRVDGVLEKYKAFGKYEAVAVHSKLKRSERDEALSAMRSGRARIVVCVDMLGEGFDLPELKIAAFHDVRKSLAVTLQLAGRFTRARDDLGDAVFIANTAQLEVRDELKRLYAQDPDWNELLPSILSEAIDREAGAQRFFSGFDSTLSDVPLRDLRPSASLIVYRTGCSQWTPLSFRNGLSLGTRSTVLSTLNQERKVLVVMFAQENNVIWTDLESVTDWAWELLIATWDEEAALLYIHGSSNSGDYKKLAQALCGNDVRLIDQDDVLRCFHRVNRLTLNNVGLNEHLGRNVRYTGRMGADVESRIGTSARRGAVRSVVAGTGYENGAKVSVGASRRGRIWSHQRFSVDAFVTWARRQGRKLGDTSIDGDHVLKGTLKPQEVTTLPPKHAIAVDWPELLMDETSGRPFFLGDGLGEVTTAFVDIEAVYPRPEDLHIRVFGDTWECLLRLRVFAQDDGADFKFDSVDGLAVSVRVGRKQMPLPEFLTKYPPTIWYADGSSLDGCHYVELPGGGVLPFDRDRIEIGKWEGVDIRQESQGEERRPASVQRAVIENLLLDPEYRVVFDDDGTGEAADIVTIRWSDVDTDLPIEVGLYHCKYAGAATAGGRVDDLYVVCGQAQRSVRWASSHRGPTNLFSRLMEREARRISAGRATRFDRGDMQVLRTLKDMSMVRGVSFSVHVVQPGLSRAAARQPQLELLAVTERYLQDTYGFPFSVLGSA